METIKTYINNGQYFSPCFELSPLMVTMKDEKVRDTVPAFTGFIICTGRSHKHTYRIISHASHYMLKHMIKADGIHHDNSSKQIL